MALRSPFRRRCACSCESALESWKSRKTRPPTALTAATARAPAGPALALAGGPRLPLRRGSARRDFAGRSCTTSHSAKSAAATKKKYNAKPGVRGDTDTRPCPKQLQRLKHHALASRQEYKRLVVAPSIFPPTCPCGPSARCTCSPAMHGGRRGREHRENLRRLHRGGAEYVGQQRRDASVAKIFVKSVVKFLGASSSSS